MKISPILLFFCFFQSCFTITEPAKIGEVVYYNLSNDIIDKIEIKLQQERTDVVLDVITINKEIKKGDSLLFKYNTENFISSAHHTQFFTSVFFKNQAPILNKLNNDNLVSGWFSGSNNVVLQLYIGNTRMVPCARRKPEFPEVNLEATKCDIDALYR